MSLHLHVQPTTQEAYGEMVRGGLMVAELPDSIWVPYAEPCWHCGEPTTWVDIGFETALHPGWCSERKWEEYWWRERISWLQSPDGQAWMFQTFGEPPRG